MASTMPTPVISPIDENFFLLDAINFNVENNPEQPFFTFADPNEPNGVSVVRHLEFGRAAHRIAHAIRPNREGADGQVVAIIALADVILYQAIIAGLIVAGFVPFPMSPRNSPEAVINLLEKTSCRRLITTNATLRPLLDAIKPLIAKSSVAEDFQIVEIPSFGTAYPNLGHELADHPFQRYPAPAKRPFKDDLCMYLHSSGSTGLPKAISQTNRVCTQWSLSPVVADFSAHIPRLTLACMALPPFHPLGVMMQLINPVFGILSISVYPPTATSPGLHPVTPSPQNVLEHTKLTRANSIMIIPSFIQVWASSAEDLDFLKNLKYLGYCGGPLAPKLGDRLVDTGVPLHAVYGGTEFGMQTRMMVLEGEEKDWQYMCFGDQAKVRWMPQSDGTFELQFLAWKKHQPMVNNLLDVPGYATSDIWENHPTKKHLWKIVGRLDDVITHSSGEKTVPGPMENIILSNSLVQGAIMFGRERDETGVLIELAPGHEIDVHDQGQLAAIRNKLWPTIEEANRIGPGFSRLFKEMILIVSKDKPLPRAGKGTVMRKAALIVYEYEIAALYEITRGAENVVPPATWSASDIEAWIVEQAVALTSGSKISPSVDLFEQGFDSLSATFLRLRIVGALRSSGSPAIQSAAQGLSQNLVYSYPVITDLATHIAAIVKAPEKTDNVATSRGTALMEELIEKYTAGFESLPAEYTPQPRTGPATVLLTGSTGNLGSSILAALLEDDRVEKVYAFNRPSKSATGQERHLERFKDKGLNPALLESSKLVFISGDAVQPDLGLDRGAYNELCRSVNVVIHNAWKLDFNQSLSSFESNIRGTRHLIDLVKSGPNASTARFVFTSSIASAQSWDNSRGPFPEEVMNPSVAVGGGYGEGKYVTERIVVKSGLQATSLRIGQISGARPKGAWATTDWVPSLVKSSIALGKLPKLEGVVSWLPMDAVAAAVVDVALSNVTPPLVLNVVHPRPVPWNELFTNIRDAVKDVLGQELELVSFGDWFSAIEARAKQVTAETLDDIPAVKLIDFFRGFARAANNIGTSDVKTAESGGMATFSTDKMMCTSDVMGRVHQLGREDAHLWVRYWHAAGFLV